MKFDIIVKSVYKYCDMTAERQAQRTRKSGHC
jgi:hypothetical protein